MSSPARLDRALIRVSGPDALSFLQGLVTQDLERLAQAGVLYGALLSPQGKVVSDMFFWADGESIVIDADPARGPDLLRRLAMYKLRANVAIETIGSCVHVSDSAFSGALPDPRLPALGWRAIATQSAAGDDAAWFDARRLALGVPDLARDAAPEEVFALEALLEELHGVDFKKGCFVGQENVSRMKRRATTRKKFCPVRFDGEPPAHGASLNAGETEVGSIRSGQHGRALALVRLDRALAATAPLTADGRPMQLDPPDWLLLPPAEEA